MLRHVLRRLLSGLHATNTWGPYGTPGGEQTEGQRGSAKAAAAVVTDLRRVMWPRISAQVSPSSLQVLTAPALHASAKAWGQNPS